MSVDNAIFQVGYLERVALGTSYPAIAHHVRRLFLGLPRRPRWCWTRRVWAARFTRFSWALG